MLYAIVRLVWRWLNRRKLVAFNQHLDFVRIKHLALDQSARNSLQHVPIVGDDLPSSAVAVTDELANFLVDLDGCVFAVVAMLGDLASQEDLLFLLAERQWSQFAHAPFADHLASHVSGSLDVVACAGAHHIEEHLFRNAPAHQDGDLRLEIVLVVVVPVVGRQAAS